MAYHEEAISGKTDGAGACVIPIGPVLQNDEVFFLGYATAECVDSSPANYRLVNPKLGGKLAGFAGQMAVVGPIYLKPQDSLNLVVNHGPPNTAITGSLVGDVHTDFTQLVLRPIPTAAGANVSLPSFPNITVTGPTDLQGLVQIEGPTKFANQDPWFDVTHPKYGALGNAGDDTVAIQKADLDASANGAILFFPPTAANVYGITASITMFAGVTYRMVTGSSMKWVGAAPGADTYMLGTTAVINQHTLRPRIEHFKLDAASVVHVIPLQLDSVWLGEFDDVYLINANGAVGQYGLKLLSSIGATVQNDTTNCIFINLRIENCSNGMSFSGNAPGSPVANNYFYGLTMVVTVTWINFIQNCDSNFFFGYAFAGAQAAGIPMIGIILGDLAVDKGVHSERFVSGSMDNPGGGTGGGQVMIQFGVCASCVFEKLFSSCGNVGGVGAGGTAGTLFTDNAGAGNWIVEWINQADIPGNMRTYYFAKGSRWLSAPGDVNGVDVFSGTAGNGPQVRAIGTDANIDLGLSGQGGGAARLPRQRPNYWVVSGGGGGQEIVIAPDGVDANITAQINAKGTGFLRLLANMANFFNMVGSVGGGGKIEVQAVGADANLDLALLPKGAGVVNLEYASTALGGGAAPTVGTIGGTGPAAAAQNAWLKVKINGVVFFIPVWQ